MSLTDDDKEYIKREFEAAADAVRFADSVVDSGDIDEIREVADALEGAEWAVSERLREVLARHNAGEAGTTKEDG